MYVLILLSIGCVVTVRTIARRRQFDRNVGHRRSAELVQRSPPRVAREVDALLQGLLPPGGNGRFVLYLRPFWIDGRLTVREGDAKHSAPLAWESYLSRLREGGLPPVLQIGEVDLPGMSRISASRLRATADWEDVLRALMERAWRVFVVPLIERGASVDLELDVAVSDAWRLRRKTVYVMPGFGEVKDLKSEEIPAEWARVRARCQNQRVDIGPYNACGGLVIPPGEDRPLRSLLFRGGAPPTREVMAFLRAAPQRVMRPGYQFYAGHILRGLLFGGLTGRNPYSPPKRDAAPDRRSKTGPWN